MAKESSASEMSNQKRHSKRNRQKDTFSVDSRMIEMATRKVSGLGASLNHIRNRAVPKDLKQQFKKARRLYDQDDLIRAIVDTQMEFGPLGFQFFMKKDTSDRASKRFNSLITSHNLKGLNRQLWTSLCTYSNVVFHWKVKPNNRDIEYIQVLNPYDVEVIPFLNGQSLMYLKVPDRVEQLVKVSTARPEERALLKNIPKKYINAVKGSVKASSLVSGNAKMVLLSNDDGEYWLIANTEGFNDRLIAPSMASIFSSIENRDLLISGDISVAYLIKNFIMHVKTGESITTGPKAGSRQNYAETKHLKALKKQFNTTGNAMELYTGHLVDIEYLFPDTKVFDPDKFISPEKRILRWGGVGEILMLGTGTNYAAGFINLKRLVAKVKCYREIIDGIWAGFFGHSTVRRDISADHIPETLYDDSLLKEYNTMVREMQALIDRGALSKQTALLKAGFNPDVEEANKQEEIDKGDVYMPTLTSMSPLESVVDKINQKKEKGEPGRERGEVTKSGGTGLGAPENPRPSTGSSVTFSIDANVLTHILTGVKQPAKEIEKLSELSSNELASWQNNFLNALDEKGVSRSITLAWKQLSDQLETGDE